MSKVNLVKFTYKPYLFWPKTFSIKCYSHFQELGTAGQLKTWSNRNRFFIVERKHHLLSLKFFYAMLLKEHKTILPPKRT